MFDCILILIVIRTRSISSDGWKLTHKLTTNVPLPLGGTRKYTRCHGQSTFDKQDSPKLKIVYKWEVFYVFRLCFRGRICNSIVVRTLCGWQDLVFSTDFHRCQTLSILNPQDSVRSPAGGSSHNANVYLLASPCN
jgi:hypothetical protein